MNLPKDPVMLMSYLNTQLRDNYDSLEALCDALDADQATLEATLTSIDYHYTRELNQFK